LVNIVTVYFACKAPGDVKVLFVQTLFRYYLTLLVSALLLVQRWTAHLWHHFNKQLSKWVHKCCSLERNIETCMVDTLCLLVCLLLCSLRHFLLHC